METSLFGNKFTIATPRPRSRGLVGIWLDGLERMRQRRNLGALSGHMLKDIGLTRVDVEMELRKHPWQM